MGFKKLFYLIAAVVILMSSISVPAKSQALPLLEMTFKSFQGNYEPLGSADWQTNISTYYYYPRINLPFTFYYDQRPNTFVYFGANGYLSLSPYGYNYYGYYTGYQITRMYAVIKAFSMYYGGPYPGSMKYKVLGNAPNRVAVFEWNGHEAYFGNYGTGSNFQIRLYETSNNVECIYGKIDYSNFYYWQSYPYEYRYYRGQNGFGGAVRNYSYLTGTYINVLPKEGYNHRGCFSNVEEDRQALYDHIKGKNRDNSWTYINYGMITNNDDASTYQPGLTLQLTAFPGLVALNPASGAILERGYVYDETTDHKPGFEVDNYQGTGGVYVTYTISGPLPKSGPDYQIIYRGTIEGTNTEYEVPVNQNGWTYFTESDASLPGAKVTPMNTGDLDLASRQDEIVGGEYLIESELLLPSAGYSVGMDQRFIIALTNDISIHQIESPKAKEDKKYPLSSGQIPIRIKVSNIGLNDVDHFTAYMEITDENGNTIAEEEVEWEDTDNPLTTGDFATIDFTNYRPRYTGDFCITFYVELHGATDDAEFNNYLPRQGESHCFNVAHEMEAEALEIIEPSGDIYVGRPVRPIVKVGNNGVSDMSDVPGTMTITDDQGDEVYISNVIIQDIPAGRYNTVFVRLPDDFVPPEMGTYEACFTVNSPDDPVDNNNTVCATFNVTSALEGVYTIGRRFEGEDRNFTTIQDAVDALYLEGITGDVFFEFTDDYYEVGDEFNDIEPSVDMTSYIVGLGEENQITFRAAQNRSVQRGGVEIHFAGGSGIGFKFGQSIMPSNVNAPVHVVRESKKKQFANFPGYVTFDGGDIKSLKFVVDNADTEFRTAFYLGNGTKNVTIKNCLIEDAMPNGLCSLPHYMFNSGSSAFEYEPDNRSTDETVKAYTSGILLRSMVPQDENDANPYGLDTLNNAQNVITGNEISHFGYGIVSLGTGVLFRQGHAEYHKYYNNNNLYEDNIISDVSRAGMFFGYETNSTVHNNRIYNVSGICGTDAAGIICGGEGEGGWNGYHTIAMNIDGNEISGVSSSMMSYGIKIEQAQTSFQHPSKGVVTFPDMPENTLVKNNVIWGLNAESAMASRAGIRLFTELAMDSGDWFLNQLKPAIPDYLTRGDMVVNNTIIMNDDAQTSEGVIVGIGLQSVQGAAVKNNAIALEDVDVSMDNPAYAGIFYEGMMPKEAEVMSDYNAFWYPEGSGAAVYRFIETDNNFDILEGTEEGSGDMYAALRQWQSWTKMDMNSVFGDFTRDLIYTGSEPMQSLRIDLYPEPPLGSILNNRGERIPAVEFDIDAHVRGPAGQRYDIGAFEFDGRMFITDVEVMNIPQPGSYMANTFNDNAEYVMAYDPVEVMARIRNNGNLDLTGHKTYIYIFRENPDGSFPAGEASAEVADTIEFNIPQTETIEVNYDFADGEDKEFYPMTYTDLIGHVPAYVVPRRFTHMENNVTPRYRIEIHVEADQNNENNMMSKIVRFYHPRSDLRILISNENADAELEFPLPGDPQPLQDEIAGRLNFDTLAAVMEDLGWSFEWDAPEGRIDVFNRNAWEEKAVDYTSYRTLFYSDAEDKALTRWQRVDIEKYLDEGSVNEKANLVIGSQEMVRENMDIYGGFLSEYLRAEYAEPGNPLGANDAYMDWYIDNDANTVTGVTVGRDLQSTIKATNFTKYTGDTPPYCGLMGVVPQGEGLANTAYVYDNVTGGNTNVMGVAQTTLTRNVVLFGVDWRHWEDAEMIVRASIDYLEKNGGVVVPIELVNFDAKENGGRVNIFWKTASELNSDRFEVEKAEMTDAGRSMFGEIAEVEAQGKSDAPVSYGPVVDRDVSYGGTYYYRLKMIDLDGQYKYSDEVEVQMGAGSLWMSEPVPNPANSGAEIEYSLPQDGSVEIAVFAADGRKLMTVFSGSMPAGTHTQSLDTGTLPSGACSVVIKSGGKMQSRQLRIAR